MPRQGLPYSSARGAASFTSRLGAPVDRDAAIKLGATLVGGFVKAGPWAGWRVTAARLVVDAVSIRRGQVAVVPASLDPPTYVCSLEDPAALKCTAAGVIYDPAQIRSAAARVRVSVIQRPPRIFVKTA